MFGKLRKVRTFHLPTRYWDEKAEKKKLRERMIRAEMGLKNDDENYMVPNLRGSFRKGRYGNFRKELEAQRKKSLIRLIIIIIILILLTYFFFGGDFFKEMLN